MILLPRAKCLIIKNRNVSMYKLSRFLFRGISSLFNIIGFYNRYFYDDWLSVLKESAAYKKLEGMEHEVKQRRQQIMQQSSDRLRKGSLAEEKEDKVFKIKFTEDFLRKREQMENIYKEDDRKRENLTQDFAGFEKEFKSMCVGLLGGG